MLDHLILRHTGFEIETNKAIVFFGLVVMLS